MIRSLLAAGMAVLAVVVGTRTGLAAPPNPACGLVTAAELEALAGGKVAGLTSGPSNLGGTEVCTASTASATIHLRLVPQAEAGAIDATKKIAGLAKQMGGHVEEDVAGPRSCYAIVPPPALAATTGFATTCSVTKGPKLAVIEIATKSETTMIPIAKLRALADKILGRL